MNPKEFDNIVVEVEHDRIFLRDMDDDSYIDVDLDTWKRIIRHIERELNPEDRSTL